MARQGSKAINVSALNLHTHTYTDDATTSIPDPLHVLTSSYPNLTSTLAIASASQRAPDSVLGAPLSVSFASRTYRDTALTLPPPTHSIQSTTRQTTTESNQHTIDTHTHIQTQDTHIEHVIRR